MKKLFYGFGSLSYSVIGQTIANLFMFFATSVLGINGTLVGLAIAISTIWDGVSDTLIGYVSDHKALGKFGKRNGYMLIATLGMSISNILLWCVPNDISEILKFVWIVVSLLILETFNTMFSTPFTALGNEMAESSHDRTKINVISTIFYLIGIMIPSVLLLIFLPDTYEYPVGQLNPNGYVKIAFVTSGICLLFGLICSITTLKKEKNNDQTNKESIKDIFHNFVSVFRNKRLNKIIWGYVFTSVSTVFLCGVGLHFFTYSFFYSSFQITFILLSLMLGNIISQPIWLHLSKKNSKRSALILGIILTILAVFSVIAIYLFRIELVSISYYLMIVAIFLCGIGSGALYSLPSAMYGDEIMSNKCDQSQVATYSGAMTFAGNIANSLAQLVIGILLDLIKFDGKMQVQSLGVQTGLALILFVGVQLSLIFACLIFSKFKTQKN